MSAKHWPSRTPRQVGTVTAWMLDADEVEAIWQGLRELRPDDIEDEQLRAALIRAQRRFEPTRRSARQRARRPLQLTGPDANGNLVRATEKNSR